MGVDGEHVGESDWDDQDLLFHADAVERLTRELAFSRTELEEEVATATSSSRIERLKVRIAAMETRLSAAQQSAASD
jgi:hypothetical protein